METRSAFGDDVKTPKYRNKKVEVDGVRYDSKKEAARHAELLLLERSGAISNLARQVRIPLVVNGKLVCTFVPDHVYVENGQEVIEDTKSPITRKHPVYRIKVKLLEALTGQKVRET